MIKATTMTLGSPIGTDNLSKQANFVIHNGAKMVSVSVDNSGGRMSHMARADIRCLFSNTTAGIEGRPEVEVRVRADQLESLRCPSPRSRSLGRPSLSSRSVRWHQRQG